LLENEKSAVGFYISAHPLDTYDTILQRERIIPAKEVNTDRGLVGQTVRMAGAIAGYREGNTKRGSKFGRLTLSDRTDAFEIMAFEDDLDAIRARVEEGSPVVVSVQIRKRDDDDSIGLSCRGIESLEHVASQSSKGLFVEIEEGSAFPSVKAALDRKTGGKGRVTIRVPVADNARFAEFKLTGRYKVTPELKQAIAAEMGVLSVEEV
jgi:DNA polymerase-3 subunit alpha